MSRSARRTRQRCTCSWCLGSVPSLTLAEHLREADDEADVCCLLGDCYACWDDAEGMAANDYCYACCPGCDECVTGDAVPDVSGWRPKMAVVA